MPETPDFEQLARTLVEALHGSWYVESASNRTVIVEQLRQVWNARGAADIALVDAHLPRAAGGTLRIPDLDRALRALDR